MILVIGVRLAVRQQEKELLARAFVRARAECLQACEHAGPDVGRSFRVKTLQDVEPRRPPCFAPTADMKPKVGLAIGTKLETMVLSPIISFAFLAAETT